MEGFAARAGQVFSEGGWGRRCPDPLQKKVKSLKNPAKIIFSGVFQKIDKIAYAKIIAFPVQSADHREQQKRTLQVDVKQGRILSQRSGQYLRFVITKDAI